MSKITASSYDTCGEESGKSKAIWDDLTTDIFIKISVV